jgi:hypothetical protein
MKKKKVAKNDAASSEPKPMKDFDDCTLAEKVDRLANELRGIKSNLDWQRQNQRPRYI